MGRVGHFRLVSQPEGPFVVEHEEDEIREKMKGKWKFNTARDT